MEFGNHHPTSHASQFPYELKIKIKICLLSLDFRRKNVL